MHTFIDSEHNLKKVCNIVERGNPRRTHMWYDARSNTYNTSNSRSRQA